MTDDKSVGMDPDDLIAMKSLLVRQVIAQEDKASADEDRKAAEERQLDASKRMSAARASFAVFGFDTTAEGFWDAVRAVMGASAWNSAFAKARAMRVSQPLPPDVPPPEATAPPVPPSSNSDKRHKDGAELEISTEVEEPSDKPTVREAVLQYLELAGSLGMKAAELRSIFEMQQGTQLHQKTIGMTLYRLSQQGMVRREGRDWFFVSRTPVTENPGGDTPGSEDSDNEKGDA